MVIVFPRPRGKPHLAQAWRVYVELRCPILECIWGPGAELLVVGPPEAEETLQVVRAGKVFVRHTWCQNDETVTFPAMLYGRVIVKFFLLEFHLTGASDHGWGHPCTSWYWVMTHVCVWPTWHHTPYAALSLHWRRSSCVQRTSLSAHSVPVLRTR